MAKNNISRRSFLFGGSAVLAGLGVASLAGCNGVGDMATTTATEGILTAGAGYSSAYIHPMQINNVLSQSVSWHVYEGLYKINLTNGECEEAIAVGDPVKVGDLAYEIEFRSDKQFSDSTFLGLMDVKNSFGKYMSDPLYKSLLDFIKSIETVSDYKIRINLNYAIDEQLLKRRLSLARIFKEGSASNGVYESILGTGPYFLKDASGEDGQIVEFSPNGYYVGDDKARAKSMKWYVNIDDNTRINQIYDGKVAVLEDAPITRIDEMKAKGFSVDIMDSMSMPFVFFNTSHDPFNDVRLRQAVLYAINDEKIASDTVNGFAEVPTSYLPKELDGYHKTNNCYSYNADKAKSLIAESGHNNLSFNLVVSKDSVLVSFVDEIVSNLAEVGIKCNAQVKSIQWDSVTEKNLSEEWDAILGLYDPSLCGTDPDLLLAMTYGDSFFMNSVTFWASTNSARHQELLSILQKGRQSNGEEQQKCWNQAQEIISAEVPCYPILHRKIATLYNNKLIKDFKPTRTAGIYLLGSAPIQK